MKYLSRDVHRLLSNMLFQFHPSCTGIKFNHLAFADDIVLFSRGDLPSIVTMMSKLKHFTAVSGLEINLAKSDLLVAGVPNDEVNSMRLATGFSLGSLPFRYLGFPVHASHITGTLYASLINKTLSLILVVGETKPSPMQGCLCWCGPSYKG